MKKNISSKFLPSALVLLTFAIVSLLTFAGAFEKFEHKFYDILLGLKKAPPEREEVLLVDIDDIALEQMGTWPWSRDKIADSLIFMRELGARTAVFDVEYLSPSEKSVDYSVYDSILENPEQNCQEIEKLFVDNDAYFSRAIQFFGNTWLTINSANLAIEYDESELDYVKKRFLYQVEDSKNFLEKENCVRTYSDFSPALNMFITRASGAGFTNVRIDSDGVRRRIPLFIKYDDGVLAQLSVAPVLKILKPEKIRILRNSVVFENCDPSAFGENEMNPRTIKIPVDENGAMLINWLKKPFAATKIIQNSNGDPEEIMDDENTSFRHCSVFNLWYLSQIEKNFHSYLEYFYHFVKNEFNPGNPDSAAFELNSLLEKANDIAEFKEYILGCMDGFDTDGNAVQGGVSDETFDEYFELRRKYFENLAYFEKSRNFEEMVRAYPEIYSEAEQFLDDLSVFLPYYEEMRELFAGKFCIIGNTGSGTTDLGSTPFQNSYPNVGTHANVYNTIMTQEFVTPVNWFVSAFFAAVLSFIAFGFHSKRKVLVQSLFGVGVLVIVVSIPVLLMRLFRVYVPIASPVLISVLSFFLVTFFRFRSSEKDRRFITDAFSQCLSKDVVQEIIKDPSKLVLGGKNYNMTAIFTDIQKFSGFSELLSADELVALLNYYLSRMSEIIIAEHGTVDKYEGDAIVAFTGAPVPMKDHAERACTAALKMKKAEQSINKEILEIALLDEKPQEIPENLYSAFKIMVKNNRTIFTRIGLNSGDIVAGFMGSDNKKNYTVMGNDVNLASRLEGVNKQYSTGGILLSEATRKMLGEQFIVRSLDRVQVVNVKTPIRLYELLAFKSDADEKFLSYVKLWEQTMKIFESGNYSSALNMFKKLLSVRPDDKTCAYYILLLEKFFVQGKYPTLQDDFGVAFNAENPSDMDKSWIGTEKEIKGTFTLLQK